MSQIAGNSLLACLCMALSTAALAEPSALPPAEDYTPPSDELTFDRDRYQRMTVPVTVAGHGPYRFLVDTGAQASVVTPRVRDDARLPFEGVARLVAMGSSAEVETFSLDALEFAGRELSNLTVALLEARNVGADGILGLDALQAVRVLIDFRERRITLADSSEGSSTSGYEIVVRARRKLGQMIITDARIDGVRTAIVIDTGAQGSHGNGALRRKLGARRTQELLVTDVNGVQTIGQVALAKEMQLGRLTLTGVPISYIESPVFEELGLDSRPALILGMQSLRMLDRVAIDFAKRRVLFDISRDAPRVQSNRIW